MFSKDISEEQTYFKTPEPGIQQNLIQFLFLNEASRQKFKKMTFGKNDRKNRIYLMAKTDKKKAKR